MGSPAPSRFPLGKYEVYSRFFKRNLGGGSIEGGTRGTMIFRSTTIRARPEVRFYRSGWSALDTPSAPLRFRVAGEAQIDPWPERSSFRTGFLKSGLGIVV